MDFTNTFYEVFHGRLIMKIKIYRNHSDLVVGFRTGLSIENRIMMERSYPGWRYVTSDNPQGFVLGPYIYITIVCVSTISGVADSVNGCQKIL